MDLVELGRITHHATGYVVLVLLQRERKKEKVKLPQCSLAVGVREPHNQWHGGKFYPTPPGLLFGGASLEKLPKNLEWSQFFLKWSEVGWPIWVFFLWSEAVFGGVELSQTPSKYPNPNLNMR